MAKKMLIDATHAEETRVVVVDGNKVEEFDFESENKRQLAGNIYLAKVTRVEPSLQAAFIDYGGNRHGFLAFSEIHPDYYQIPVADREALLAEEREYAKALAEEEEERESKKASRSRSRSRGRSRSRAKAADAGNADAVATKEVSASGMDVIEIDAPDLVDSDDEGLSPAFTASETPVETPASDETTPAPAVDTAADVVAEVEVVEDGDAEAQADPAEKDENIERVADDDTTEEIRRPRKVRPRKYKIQEVIKVRQILLVQVVKEERGNKGAALTTYLSLAGRYCVLMPNTARGGGISRKITNAADRKKLKEIANDIEVPDGAGLIIRTAGAQRTKTEIKRDYEYLLRLWEQIRELTLKSIAPAKIYEEGNLIKRSIRDLYNKEIDEVFVEGEDGYRVAKDFMKMIMPSHAKNVKLYKESLPLFARYQVESYLASMFNPTVQLKSGGYIVIGVTEALVAIDVNSGRSTKEGSIEDTALKTNLEAAEEIARQLRLRDLAGLIVIDFIDMEERRNNTAVEKRFKERLKNDRARIQVGRISGFGLMEMSRQRLRPGMIEATTQPCPHCHGTGLIRSDDSLALSILRQLEEEGTRRRSREALVKVPVGIANYLVNQKREHIAGIEAAYGMAVRIEADPFLISPDFSIEKFKTATRMVPEVSAPVVSVDAAIMSEVDEEQEAETPEEPTTEEAAPKKRRRRRRRRRSGGGDAQPQAEASDADAAENTAEIAPQAPEAGETAEKAAETAPGVAEEKPRKVSRSRAGGAKASEPVAGAEIAPAATEDADTVAEVDEAETPKKPKAKTTRKKRTTRKAADAAAQGASDETATEAAPDAEPAEPAQEKKPKKATRSRAKSKPKPETAAARPPAQTEPAVAEPTPPAPEKAPEPVPVAEVAEKPETAGKPKKKGWWSLGK